MNDYKQNITLSDAYGQGYLSLFYDFSSELLPHEMALLELLETLDYSNFDASLKREANIDPKSMAIIIIYSYMLNTYSSRNIERLCKRDMFALAILSGSSAPDHTTINRFIQRNANPIDELFYDVVKKLEEKGELLKETVFQDGTKIESRAGKYTFVWKGAVTKNAEKCEKRLRQYLNKANELGLSLLLEEGNDFQSVYNELIVVKNKIKEMDLPFDAPLKKGRGNKQKRLVKHYKQICEDLKKINDYDISLALIGDNRNSMSKTDPDATFMRMKEDSMGNGQLKPGYNIQIAADANYIVGATISCDRTDYETCIPMIEKLEEKLDWKYTNYCADSGYDNVNNYNYLKGKGYTAYIKPQDWEISKTRNYKKDIGKYQNMAYNKEEDYFTCANGNKLERIKTCIDKRSGSTYGVYKCCESCIDCPCRTKCMKKSTKECKEMNAYIEHWEVRDKARTLLETEKGIILRQNRSIMAEGCFAQIKANNKLRRFTAFCMRRVFSQWLLMCIAVNVKHYTNRHYNYQLDEPDWYKDIA